MTRYCSVEGCKEKHRAKGYCKKHYDRVVRYGDPFKYLKKSDGEGHIRSDGYHQLSINSKPKMVHRLIMEKYFNRILLPSEDVHHIDGNRLNNDINNLQIISHADHAKLHALIRPAKLCSIPGCTKKYNSKGLCNMHYLRMRTQQRRKLLCLHG